MPIKENVLNEDNINIPVQAVHVVGTDAVALTIKQDITTTNGTATIAAAASLSDAVDLGSNRAHALVIGGAWVAAAITFQVSLDGVTYNDLNDMAGEVTVASGAVAANKAIVLDASKLAPYRYLKIRSGTSAAAVAQTGGATVTVVGITR